MTTPVANAPEVYRLLAAAHNAAADRAILRALPSLERGYRRVALEVLVRRRRLGALVELVSGFADHPVDLRGDIVAHVGSLEHALRVMIEQEQVGPRVSAIELIAESDDCRLAYLLSGALAQSCATTRERSGKALLSFAERYLARTAEVTDETSAARVAHDGRHLAAALERALQCWELHFRTEVLTASAWLAGPLEAVIAEKVAQPRSRLAHAFNELLSTQPDPRLAAFVLRALTIPSLRARAARIIGRCEDDAFMTALIDESWLLKDLGVRQACTAVRELNWLRQSNTALLRLPQARAAPAVRLVGATGLTSDAKVRLFSELFTAGDARLRRAALWQLVSIDTETATRALRTIVGRKDGPAAEMAERELFRRQARKEGPTGPGATGTGSGNKGLKGRDLGRARRDSDAGQARSPQEPLDDIFCALASLDERRREAALDDPVLRTPAAARYLRAKLASADADERAGALRIARLANLIDEVSEQVYRLSHDPDGVVRAAAMTALAQVPTPASARILRQALHDPEARVQANAIEALDALEVERYDEWIESALESPSARVRASAIKALLKCDVRRAAEALIAMLESDACGDRLSALWVVERLNLASLAERIETIAQVDADEEVRRRAAEIARRAAPRRTCPDRTGGADAVVDEVEP